jgi:cell division protein ZapA (FtsZ GTPase activity inhibitor)
MSDDQNNHPPTEATDVTIFNQTYRLRSKTGSAYVLQIARIVDERMREISSQLTTHDVTKIAILTALNIADEMQALRDRYEGAGETGGKEAVGEQNEPKPQSWFEDFFEAKVETKNPNERLSSQVSAKLQSLRQPNPAAPTQEEGDGQ